MRKRKDELRSRFLRVRNGIAGEEYRENSAAIISRLKKSPLYQRAEYVHCYVSMNRRKEVDTHSLLREMLSGKKRVAVPVTDFDRNTLTHLVLDSFEDLNSNRWGVPEPDSGEKADVGELDLIVVPMVAGDAKCNRLGYGKGFYDRFLSQTGAPKIGLSFECCMAETIPVENFDVQLDRIITENRVVHRD